MASASTHLALHASLVLTFGVLLGAPYGRAINRRAPDPIVNSWRVAHQSLPMAAITGHRGLTSDGQGLQRIVYYANLIGAGLSLLACAGLVFVCFASVFAAKG